MAVAFDAYSEQVATSEDPQTWTHTPVGTPRGILVVVVAGSTTDLVGAVTYGGVAMTEVTGSPNLRNTAAEGLAVHCFFLGASIPTGAQTVSVDLSTAFVANCAAVSLTADADTEIEDVDATIDTGSAENPSVTLSLGGKNCFCAIVFSSGQDAVGSITPLSNWTTRWEVDGGSSVRGFYTYDVIGTADVTAGWTQTAEDALAIAVAITEVASGALNIVPNSVAWSWSATDVSLERGREIVPDMLAWSWSSTDVTLNKGKTLVPDTVAWSWAATDTSLEHGKEIVPDTVAWSWTITDAALEKGWEVVPDTVAWAYTVTDASLEHGFEIVPDSVSWAWAATDVTLTKIGALSIVPDSVAWSWSAQDVSLEHGYELTPDAVDWTWSVGDVTLTHGGTSAPQITPTGGIPLSYEEWARRTRKDEPEDAPLKPGIIELIGPVEKTVETKPFTSLPPIETGLSDLTRSQLRRMKREAKRRREDEDWLLLN